mgnify:CR=1 FL=1
MAFRYAMAFSLAILLGFVLNHSASIQYLPSFTLTNNLVCQHIRAICHLPVAEGDRRLVQEKFTVTARDTGVLPRLSGTCPCSFCRTDTRGAS